MDKEEQLAILREVTKLGVIPKLRLYMECKKAQRMRDLCEINDPTHTYSVDYTQANNLEHYLRMRTLENSLYEVWEKYKRLENDKICLREFAENYLETFSYNKNNGRALKKY